MTRLCQEKECYLIEFGYWADKTKNRFKRNLMIPYRLIGGMTNRLNRTGVFKTAFRYDKENINESFLYGDLYFDFDDKNNFENVRQDALNTLSYIEAIFKIKPEESQIYFSGGKGVHIVVPAKLLGVTPNKKLNAVYKVIATSAHNYSKNKTGDLVIYDNKRLFRIPNTIHETTGLYKIPITIKELRGLGHEEIKTLAKTQRKLPKQKESELKVNPFASRKFKEITQKFEKAVEKSNQKNYYGKKTLSYMPPCIKEILDNGAQEGSRNNSAAVLSSYYRNTGESLNRTLELILEWNSEKNTPPSGISEVQHTVRSVFLGSSSYGCSTLKQISICSIKTCKLKKGEKNGK